MADSIILEIPDVKGESTLEDYAEKITLLSFNHALSQPMQIDRTNQARTVGRVNCQDFMVLKIMDASSVPIIDALNTAKNLGTVKVYVLKAVGDAAKGQIVTMTYTFEETMVSSYVIDGGGGRELMDRTNMPIEYRAHRALLRGSGDGGDAIEAITFNFTKMSWNYDVQKTDGTKGGNFPSNWSLKLGKKE